MLTIPLSVLCMAGLFAAPQPPYPEALERAAVTSSVLDSPINDALLLGNGDLNGLLYAEGDDLVFRVTKNDVWDARLDTPLDPPLPTLARLLELGKGPWPDKNWIFPAGLEWEGPDSYHAHAYPCPRACAVVRVAGAARGPLMGKLDIRRAVAIVHGAAGPVTFRVLADSNVLLIESEQALEVILEPIRSADLPAPETGENGASHWVEQTIPGDLDWPGMSFSAVLTQKGTSAAVAVATSLETETPRAAATTLTRNTLSRPVSERNTAHESVWDTFWSRSGVQLGDEVLERTWYRNLYFLRCVTREGVVSPGLFAGLLDDAPAWHGDYHTNYNIQQTFWAAYSANQVALTEPYDRLISAYLPRARWLARTVFQLEGAYFPHVLYAYEPADPDTVASPNGRQYIHHVWAFTLGVTGFTVQPLWWRYLHQPDRAYLEEVAYPAVRDVADFYAAFVERCERQGDTVELAPSMSPEHWGWTDNFEKNRNVTFDIAYFHMIFDAATEGAGILDRDTDRVARWRAAQHLLPDYPRHAGPPEVVVDVAGAEPIRYNIPVPTTPVFPADRVRWDAPEAERELFLRTLEHLEHNGNNAPIMLAVTRARLGAADAHDWLRTEIDRRERRNGQLSFNRLEPRFRFNDFGHYTEMFGVVLPITELVMQSVGGTIRLFPAWPEWFSAAFTQLRAEGGFLVSAQHDKGVIDSVRIESTAGGALRLASPWPAVDVRRNDASSWETVALEEHDLVHLVTTPGEIIQFRAAIEN